MNGENNRDGNDANWSWNSGREGITKDECVKENRLRRMRAMLATLFTSFGTPMLVAGDEFCNTQMGNNNPYCQDNVITWIVWDAISKNDMELASYVRNLIELRQKTGIYSRCKFFTGDVVSKRKKIKDLTWLTDEGKEFTNQDWYLDKRKNLGLFIYNPDVSYLMIYNADAQHIEWLLPAFCRHTQAKIILDSSQTINDFKIDTNKKFIVPAWEVMVIEIKKTE
jgi:glycogen operon protein